MRWWLTTTTGHFELALSQEGRLFVSAAIASMVNGRRRDNAVAVVRFHHRGAPCLLFGWKTFKDDHGPVLNRCPQLALRVSRYPHRTGPNGRGCASNHALPCPAHLRPPLSLRFNENENTRFTQHASHLGQLLTFLPFLSVIFV